MRRKTFDALVSGAGLLLAVVLIAAGGVLAWGSSFVASNVHSQLASQKIFFPPKAAFANAKPGSEITPSMITTIEPYAGQQLLTGPQARAYADDFIAVHLSEMPYGGVYATVSAQALANPTDTALKAEQAAVFQGTSLRSMLLNAYGWATIGTVAGIAAIGAFVAGGLMLLFAGLGFRHYRKVSPAKEIVLGSKTPAPLEV
ncbi:MAG TPA: hypothetical protein VNG13_01130 [Mycobacteriales bacterium]|nr:hypothetical protein [Mycobacteriales bacterium]